MSWIRNSARIAAAALGCVAAAASAGTLIVRSGGPSAKSYPPGMTLSPHQKIALKANDMVVVLGGGGTRTLTGPGLFDATAPSGATADSKSTLLALVTQRTERRARIGAVRSVGGPATPKSPNIWYVDTGRSATACVTDPAAVILWRGAMSEARTLKVTRVSDHRTVDVDWLKGESSHAWPSALPLVGGADYRFDWGAAQPPAVIRFAVLGAAPGAPEDVAGAFIRNGCSAQLDLLIEMAGASANAAPPAG